MRCSKVTCWSGVIPVLLATLALAPGARALNLPKTGQTLCYNSAGSVIQCAGTGQDGEIQAGVAWPQPRFTDNRDGTVTDNLTKLIWLKNANCADLQPATGLNWTAALSAANGLHSGQCGLSDASVAGQWRLPNVNELESLIDLSQFYHPLPPGSPFLDVQWGYWTSTTLAAFPGNAEWIAFDNGGARGNVKTNLSYLWPVRGTTDGIASTGQTSCWDLNGIQVACAGTGQDADKGSGAPWPAPRFVDRGMGTIADRLTGLVWLKNADCFGSASSQDFALAAVKTVGSGTCGVRDGSQPGDWRLPNRKELRSLLNYAAPDGGAWLASQGFANIFTAYYWSSDSYANVVDLNWLPVGADPNLGDKWMVRTLGGTVLSSWVTALVPPEVKHLIPLRNKLQPAITWAQPAAVPTGTPLSSTQLSASASVPGSFLYAPAAGSTLPVGNGQPLVAIFTPNDQDNYATVSKTVSIDVFPNSAVITLGGLAASYDGTPKAVTAVTTPVGKQVLVTYDGSSSAPKNAGSYAVLATVVDPAFSGSATGRLVIGKAALTVSADSQLKDQGAPDPVLSYRYSGLAPGDSSAVFSGNLSRAAGEGPGSYSINQGTLSAGDNYGITFVGALLTIEPMFAVTPQCIGSGTLAPGSIQAVHYNDSVSFTLAPAAGYRIVSASGCGGALAGSSYRTDRISADCSVNAVFGPLGDLNGDGKVDISDALRALLIAVHAVTPSTQEMAAGDVGPLRDGKTSADGHLDISDALLILQKAVGVGAW